MIIILLVFVLATAMFHTLIISTVFDLKITPKWLLFALYPVLEIVAYYIHEHVGIGLMIGLFALTFVSLILFIVVKSIKDGISKIRKSDKPLWRHLFAALGLIVLIILFCLTGPLFIFALFAYIFFFASIINPQNKDRFLKLQIVLPTSKIRSMAMGLVEVEGELEVIKPLTSPIKSKPCIGYRYTIEDIKTDDDGHDSYHTTSDKTKCNRFFICDDTGKVLVDGEKLGFVWLEIDEQHRASGRRYTQYLLNPCERMLLIGNATLDGDIPMIAHDEIRNVFAIAPSYGVNLWNRYRPLRRKMSVYACFLALIVAFVLILSIRIEEGQVLIRISKDMFLWEGRFMGLF